MAAPIQRYSDPSLYGGVFVKPFDKSYQWTRTVVHPLHPKCNLIAECAVRAMKILTGTLAMAMTALPALVGRVIQMVHYHCIPKEVRANPEPGSVGEIRLPRLESCALPPPKKYHGTSEEGAIGILRWGFDITRTASGAKMGEAIYVSASDVVSAAYGQDQLILSLDLRETEVAYLSDSALREFQEQIGEGFSDKRVMTAMRELFYQNGYRAIKYDLDHYGKEEAWAIYDPTCISIKQIRPSPNAVPAASVHRVDSPIMVDLNAVPVVSGHRAGPIMVAH